MILTLALTGLYVASNIGFSSLNNSEPSTGCGLIILEPEGRNTAPAIALAALAATADELAPILVVMPADHKSNP